MSVHPRNLFHRIYLSDGVSLTLAFTSQLQHALLLFNNWCIYISTCISKRLWNELDGKCGTCGDPYDATVRENEAGGIYATGTIARKYTRGQIIKV